MRILDTDTNLASKNIILYLKPEEAKELYDSIGALLAKNNYNTHSHIADKDFDHEVTVVLYNEQQMETLNERSKQLILEGQ